VKLTTHSPPSSAEVKEYMELHLNSPNMPPWHGMAWHSITKKHRDNFNFYPYQSIMKAIMKMLTLEIYDFPLIKKMIKNKLTTWSRETSCDANSHPASQEILCLLWKVHYHVHKNPQPVPILSQVHPVYTFHPIFLRFSLILSYHLYPCL
jgi:hypothetical protein